MSKKNERGGSDIESTITEFLEKQIARTTRLLENEVYDLITSTDDIEQIVQSTSNPTSQG